MTDIEIERLLARLPVRTPEPARERELLALLNAPPALVRAWWTRGIPLWQAAAACIAVFAASLIWLRELPRPPATPAVVKVEPVVVRIEQPLFANAAAAPERIDPSRWGSFNVAADPRVGRSQEHRPNDD